MLRGEDIVDTGKNVFVSFSLKPHDFYNFRKKIVKKGAKLTVLYNSEPLDRHMRLRLRLPANKKDCHTTVL